MSNTNLQTTFAKSRLTRVCGLLSLLIMGVWQTTSAQQTDDICLANDMVTPLAVETSSFNFATQSPIFLVGAFIALLILLFGVVKFRKNSTFLLTIGLIGFSVFAYNHTLDAQLGQGVHCVCHADADDVMEAPPLVGQTGVQQGITDHTQCMPEGLYDSSSDAPYCDVYDTDGREVMTSERRVIGYFATWRTGKNGQPAFLVPDIPWGKLTHINYAFGHVDAADGFRLSVNTDVAGNSGTDMTWPEYGVEMDSSLSYTGHFNQFSKYKAMYPNVKLLLSVGGWAETGGHFGPDGSFVDDGGFYAMTTNADGSPNMTGINNFADSAVDFLREYPFFDGIDIDYEYATSLTDTGNPTDFAVSNARRAYLNETYDIFMMTLREKLDAAAEADGEYYMLTVAAPASSYMLRGLEQYQTAKYLDFLNMMSYDLHGSWNAFAGHNAPLYDTGVDAELDAWLVYDTSNPDTEPYMAHGSLNTDWAAKYFGGIIPPGRINVGIPYYTRGWQDVDGGTNGLGGLSYPKDGSGTFDRSQCAEGTALGTNGDPTDYCGNGAVGIDNIWHDLGELGKELGAGANPMWHAMNLENGVMTELMEDYVEAYAETPMTDPMQAMTGDYVRYYDDVAVAPYLWNEQKQVFISTEDTESFDTKVQYVIDEGLGGIMFWELSGDYSEPSDFTTATDGACGDTYFMGSTLTSRGFDDLQSATPYEIVQNPRTMPAQTADVTVELFDYPQGDYNFPVNPQLRVVANDGSDLSGAIIEFDISTSAPPSAKSYWGEEVRYEMTVVDEGHSGNGNAGGLNGDFHRLRVELLETGIGSTFETGQNPLGESGGSTSGLLFYLPFSTISAVTISYDNGSTWYAAKNGIMDSTSAPTTPTNPGGGTDPDPTPTPPPSTGGGTAAFSDDFASGAGNWFVNSVAISGSGGEGCVTITDAGDNAWDAAFGVSERFSLMQGDDYAVSFDAYASESTSMNVLWSLDAAPWTTYMVESVALTTQSQTFNYTFTMGEDDDPASVFAFQVGGQSANMVCIDNVELTYLSSAPPPPNSNVVSCASVGQSTAGIPTYPSWPNGDHALEGDFIIHDGFVWQAAWWMGQEPGTETGWYAYGATSGSTSPYCSIP